MYKPFTSAIDSSVADVIKVPRVTASPIARARTLAKLVGAAALVSVTSGCLISPYWNQVFASHTQAIPIQAYAYVAGETMKIECHQAFHGGLHTYDGQTWEEVAVVAASTVPMISPKGETAYSVTRNEPLPESCWRQETNGNWYTAIRMSYTDGNPAGYIPTYDADGLKCFGEAIGRKQSWFGWVGRNCEKSYSSGGNIPYVAFRANS